MMRHHDVVRLAQAHLPRFSAFVAVGVLNTAFGYAVYLAGLWFGLAPVAALAVATAIGALFNYATIGGIVFGERRVALLPRFLLVYCVLYAVNVGLLEAVMACGAPAWLAQAIALPIVVTAGYTLMNLVVFRGQRPGR
ncbi:MAG: GtrA family protein [Alphaproteobacteria bacterium]|nr:GtrA family protein [Alphaproteobacteria bacterium]